MTENTLTNSETREVYRYEPEFSLLNSKGFLKPAGFQTVVNNIVGVHLKKHNIDFERLISMDLSWVLLSLTIEPQMPVRGTEPLFITTWHSENKGIFFRRELQAKNEKGEVVFNCATYSTMLDLVGRTIYRKRPLPFEIMEPEQVTLLDARPTFKGRHEFSDIATSTVQRSYIDGLGHVNNARYGDFCYDSLSDSEAELDRLSRMEIYFVSELKQSETYTAQKACEDNKTIVRGYNNENDKVSFYGVFHYD